MRKLDISNYSINEPQPDGSSVPATTNVPYSLVALLFHPDQKISAIDAVRREILATKILTSPSPILIEESDFALLQYSFDTYTHFSFQDVPLIRRIQSTPIVEVQETS